MHTTIASSDCIGGHKHTDSRYIEVLKLLQLLIVMGDISIQIADTYIELLQLLIVKGIHNTDSRYIELLELLIVMGAHYTDSRNQIHIEQ